MTEFSGVAARFLDLHVPGEPLVMANPWDAGAAKVLAAAGFQALATTSSGFASTLGRLDGTVTRDEALAHAAAMAAATDRPVNADLENGFADDAAGVGETMRLAALTGVAGASIEDFTRDRDAPIFPLAAAVERVAAAAEAAHRGPTPIVLTARAENHLYLAGDLADTIARLQAYQEAGADVLFAPGVLALDEIRTLVSEVDRPVNVLALAGAPSVPELAAVGVARVSVGGSFTYVALGAVLEAARELLDAGTYGYLTTVAAARGPIRAALSS